MSELVGQFFLLLSAALIVIGYFAFVLVAILWLRANVKCHARCRRGSSGLQPDAASAGVARIGRTDAVSPARSAGAALSVRSREDCA